MEIYQSAQQRKRARELKLILLVAIGGAFFLVYAMAKKPLLKYYGACTVAHIVDKKEYRRFSRPNYQYEFTLKGKHYEGDSKSSDPGEIGHSLHIVYLPLFPSISAPVAVIRDSDTCSIHPVNNNEVDSL